jgi:hypothetical protein
MTIADLYASFAGRVVQMSPVCCYAVGRNIKWCSHYGTTNGSSKIKNRIKYLGINLNKQVKYNENYKTLKKELKTPEGSLMFMN